MKYIAFIRCSEDLGGEPPTALQEAMGRFIDESVKNGSLVDTGGLMASKHGKRVRVANGAMKVIDGPFTESKEVVGGWAILEADSMEQATRFIEEFMQLHLDHFPEFVGECELRPHEFKLVP